MKSLSVKTFVWIVLTLVVAGALGAQTQPSSSNDDDKGKALVQSKCTKCHGLEEVEAANLEPNKFESAVRWAMGSRQRESDLRFSR